MAFPLNPTIGQNFLDASTGEMYVYLGLDSSNNPHWVKTNDEDIARTSDDEVITGSWTFSQPISTPAGGTIATDAIQISGSSLEITSDTGNGNPGISFATGDLFEISSAGASLIALNSLGALRVNGSFGTSGQVLSSRGPNNSLQWITPSAGTVISGSINGTTWNGTSAITTSTWGTARNITIGATQKEVNGSANIGWSISEIGAVSSTANETIGGVKQFSKSIRETSINVAASDIDLTLGSVYRKTISAYTTFTVSGVASSGAVSSFILELTNGGSFPIVWFSGVLWQAGQAPLLSSPGVDVLGFYTYDGGATWTGVLLAKDVR